LKNNSKRSQIQIVFWP